MSGYDFVAEARIIGAIDREGLRRQQAAEAHDEAVESFVKADATAEGYKAQRDALVAFIIEKGLHHEFGDLFAMVNGKTAPYGVYRGGERKGIVKNKFRHVFDVAFEKAWRDGIAKWLPHKMHLQNKAKDEHW